jgi:carbamoyl-phosphate synthase large subunit
MKGNILITSAGRRVSLVRAFQNELIKRIPEGKVFTADMNPVWSAACKISDGYFVLPQVTDTNYINELRALCLKMNIVLVVPTIDTELLILAKNFEKFKSVGVTLAVSDYSLIARCRDKRKTNELFIEMGIEVPLSIDKHRPTFPLFVKPYDGSLSKGILLINSESEWNSKLLNDEKLMFMEYLNPRDYQEFTVDAYYDQNSVLMCMVPRRRIEVRCGEISKGCTEKGSLYEKLKIKFGNLSGARSCLTMQFFEHRKSGRIVGIEINPRFGGGYPLSYAAHANYPAFLIEEYLLAKEITFFEKWVEGRVMLRFDDEVIFDA